MNGIVLIKCGLGYNRDVQFLWFASVGRHLGYAMVKFCFSKPVVAFAATLASLLSTSAIAQEQVPITATFHSTLVDDGNDLIFPSAIKASNHFDEPLANWYLYTSPHRGANIRLYTADALTGPWKLHGEVVGKEVGRADHVSSPHAIWNETEQCLFLYVHAPNNQTIFCRSNDGVRFVYGGVCVTSQMLSNVVGFKSRSASYARVYQHRIPEFDNRYTMTVTASASAGADGTSQNAIVLCTSDDGVKWKARRKLIDDGNGGRTFKSLDGAMLTIGKRNFLVFAKRSRADEGKKTDFDPVRLHLAEGDENWRKWTDRGVLYDPSSAVPDELCARGALFVEDAGQRWLFYESGPKNGARIALLKIDKVPLPAK